MLTREQILNMPAGEYMNAMIIIHVFKKVTETIDFTEDSDETIIKHAKFLRDYSTDISAAWEVFMKVDFDKEQSKVVHGSIDQWICYFDDISSNECGNAPLAICRAALLTTIQE